MLSGKRIILGVTGGIAAYKAAFLLRAFQQSGAQVRVTMTQGARQFVGTETFSSLSKHAVAVDIFPDVPSTEDSWTRHISWGEWGDLFVIAPCTANTLAKIAGGYSDNMLTATVLSARCPMLICPTMDGEMYQSPAVQRNLQTLKEDGYHILEPQQGYLASGLQGKGRLPETETILDECRSVLGQQRSVGPLAGKKVVVTAGPTREFIDPVRYISNPSSGKMGIAMAEAARDLGGEVTLVHGPIQIPAPNKMNAIQITSTDDLFKEVQKQSSADIIIMAAAVADFTPETHATSKIKKNGKAPSLKLRRTPDILSWLGEHKKKGQTLIGFAMETEKLIEHAGEKRTRKKADWIIANSIADDKSGFGTDTNTVTLLGDAVQETYSGPKKVVARKVLDRIFSS
ncbi:bifunctional phosphopantothenoylcysteine decarboxylase/phosphopantothenate--cysteine ligase CoaBC [Fodinibius sediminis]|uniref:Coenzyme A biosynthesis bifunctional protein CoaBC n=1 Tax=Fodinibius sediminis TaxID=1214077 RepID=A0A521CA95_9BACT|nr:bifunctional phosphopantothenoylcysteine decarboxylase/phosphopantothenate--cysteine ligase CoaBC [Fodinibius sediminis]SMO56359.1 phosphopantothenoylcysteine decarboxylase / phosphopantothenate--cysteine ligase [Fodinibius sediminis]